MPTPDSEAEQAAELFKSRVWTNAWEPSHESLGMPENHVQATAEAGSGKVRKAEIEKSSLLVSGQDERSIRPEFADDEHELDEFDPLPDFDEDRFPDEIIVPERSSGGQEEQRFNDEEQSRIRRIELTRTPEGGGLPL